MKSKGFTLIELLAVIVILAIISLIATPIVLNIIKDSKDSATLQSAQFYIDAVEHSITKKMMDEPAFKPSSCEIQSDGNLKCNGADVKVEVKGEVPTSGTVDFENGKIKEVSLTVNDKAIVKQNNKLVYDKPLSEKTIDDICTYDSTSGVAEKIAGAKYSCEVKKGTRYNFYVLTTPKDGDATIDLIMDQNINSDGTPAGTTKIAKNGENIYNLVEWNVVEGQKTSKQGPVTVMNYLYNATKNWTNIPALNYTYMDHEIQGSWNGNETYTSIISTNGVAVITSLDGVVTATIGSETEPLRARLPIYSDDANITEIPTKTDATAYLYGNLGTGNEGTYGYWLLSSFIKFPTTAYLVNANGYTGVNVYDDYGVRPVITLKI